MPTGPRIRGNNAYGVTLDNPLTAGATTFNSNQLIYLPVVSSAHAVITLDPVRQFGDPEIIIVTAHSAASTVATITRGAYGTIARSHPVGTVWVHAATDEDFISILTSSTRPTDPYRGERIFETDTNRFVSRSTGDVWQQDGLFFDPPACKIFHSVAQNIPDAGSEVVVVFNSERYDTDNMHSTVTLTNRVTFNTAGIYQLTFNGFIDVRSDYNQVYAVFRANGTTVLGYNRITPTTFGAAPIFVHTTTYKFAVSEYVEVLIFQDNVANATVNLQSSGNASPEFSATYLGRGN